MVKVKINIIFLFYLFDIYLSFHCLDFVTTSLCCVYLDFICYFLIYFVFICIKLLYPLAMIKKKKIPDYTSLLNFPKIEVPIKKSAMFFSREKTQLFN